MAKRTRDSEGTSERVSIPKWLPPVAFAVVTVALFRDFIFSDAMLFGSDTLSLGYMARSFYAEALGSAGGFPRWAPLLLGGTPFLESLAAGDALYPTSLLLFVMAPHRALGWKLIIHVFLAGCFMFGWVRTLGRSRAAALVSGVAYGVAPILVAWVRPGHDGKLFVVALTPLLFWAMEWTFRRRGLLPFVAVSAVVALVILTTHFQLAYFLFGAAGLFYAFRAFVEGPVPDEEGVPEEGKGTPRTTGVRLRWGATRFGLFLAAAVLGAAAAGIQIVPAFQYVTEFSRRTATTTRASALENRLYASSWGLHPEELVSFVVPEFAGNNAGGDAEWTQGTYWGRNGHKDNHEYAGLVVLLLAVVGFFGTPRRALRWFLAAVGVLSVLYALGTHTPVWGLFYALMPGVKLFRAPSMVSFLFGFASVTLAAFGVDRLLGLAGAEPRRPTGEGDEGAVAGRIPLVLWACAGALLLGTIVAASGALSSMWIAVAFRGAPQSSLQILEDHQRFIVQGFFLATLLAAATAGTALAARRGVLRPRGVLVALGLLVLVDGFRVSQPFIQTFDFHDWARPDPIVRELQRRQTLESPFRVLSLLDDAQDVKPAMFGLELAAGHHPNDLARYRELIGMVGSGMPQYLTATNVYRILNVRYLIWQDWQRGAFPDLQPVLQTQVEGRVWESLYQLDGLPRARLVGAARVVPDQDAVAAILDPGFDPETEVVLSEEPPIALDGGPVEGSATWTLRDADRQVIEVTSDQNALLVIADNWFPAWHATVDGAPTPVLRAYHTLRAVPVGPGQHTVELVYRSATLRWSLVLSLGTVLVLVAVGVGSYVRGARGRESGEA